jgi:hypothetical protein
MGLSKQVYLMSYGTWKKHASELHAATCLPIDRALEPHQLRDEHMCVVVAETHEAKHAQLEREGEALPHHSESTRLKDEHVKLLAPLGVEWQHFPYRVYKLLGEHHPSFKPRNL